MRSFVALNLPTRAIDDVLAVQHRLRQQASADQDQLRWIPPANMHVTLRFLGEIPEESTPAIQVGLKQRLDQIQAFPVTVAGVGAFPDPQQPKVLWIGVQSAGDQLQSLQQSVDHALTDLGFAADTREFRPHITLARVKGGGAGLVNALTEVPEVNTKATEVVLYRSEVRRQGAEYTSVARFALARAT